MISQRKKRAPKESQDALPLETAEEQKSDEISSTTEHNKGFQNGKNLYPGKINWFNAGLTTLFSYNTTKGVLLQPPSHDLEK